MTELSHRIEIYEPYEYDGPNPLMLTGQGLLITPDRKDAFLLSVDKHIVIDGLDYNQIVVRPKYSDPIERATKSNCTVIVSLVLPDCAIEIGNQYQYTDVLNWGIGKINQLRMMN